MNGAKGQPKSAVLHRHLCHEFLPLVRGEGNFLVLEGGRRIFDASGGAAVVCIGHGDQRVIQAVKKQLDDVAYCATIFYSTQVCDSLCQDLINSTHGHMSRAYIINSGSEAMEAAMKLARQYYLEKKPPEPQRTRFISRFQSYHGTTLGALSVGGHKSRRAKFEPLLHDNVSRISPCFAYRGKNSDENDEVYVERLVRELEDEFLSLGPDTVCAFVAEPVVGAALGCVPSVAGYFKAVRAICDKYGALLIMDEVMCGMGRTGTLHAWEQENAVPDIQTIGKGLGGGYQPVAGILIHRKVIEVLEAGSAAFVHGQTYQGHPVACAASLEVQRIIRDDDLLGNVRSMGKLLSERLVAQLSGHPNVGDIRGRGLFWGIEFVKDRSSKEPFLVEENVAMGISELGLTEKYGIAVYPGTGTADGTNGDHIIIAPAYNVSEADVEFIVKTVRKLIWDYFSVKMRDAL